MGRTRAALLAATAECVARYGIRKTTMVDVASKSRVAKATLYNHFRTKDDVLAALVEQQVAELVEVCTSTASASGLTAALALAAERIGAHASLRKAAADEPALLAPLMVPTGGRGWTAARTGVASVLSAAGVPDEAARVELVLRWIASQVLWPLDRDAAQVAAEALVAGFQAPRSAVDVPAAAAVAAPVAGLGWPQ
jgi:AcrR family transcriptional regulator